VTNIYALKTRHFVEFQKLWLMGNKEMSEHKK